MAACSDGDAGQVKKPHPLTARSLFQHVRMARWATADAGKRQVTAL
jgi:hypothetical protein